MAKQHRSTRREVKPQMVDLDNVSDEYVHILTGVLGVLVSRLPNREAFLTDDEVENTIKDSVLNVVGDGNGNVHVTLAKVPLEGALAKPS